MRNSNFKKRVAFLLTGAMAFSSLPLNTVAADLNPVTPVFNVLASEPVVGFADLGTTPPVDPGTTPPVDPGTTPPVDPETTTIFTSGEDLTNYVNSTYNFVTGTDNSQPSLTGSGNLIDENHPARLPLQQASNSAEAITALHAWLNTFVATATSTPSMPVGTSVTFNTVLSHFTPAGIHTPGRVVGVVTVTTTTTLRSVETSHLQIDAQLPRHGQLSFVSVQGLDHVGMNPSNLAPVPANTALHMPQHFALGQATTIPIASTQNIGDINQAQRDQFGLHNNVQHVQPGSHLQFVVLANQANVIYDAQNADHNANAYVEFSTVLNNAQWHLDSSGLRGFNGNFVRGEVAANILRNAGLPLTSERHRPVHNPTNQNNVDTNVIAAPGVPVGPALPSDQSPVIDNESWLLWEPTGGRSGGGRLSGPGWAIDQTSNNTAFLQIHDIAAFRTQVGDGSGQPVASGDTPGRGATMVRFPLIIRTTGTEAVTIAGSPLSPGANVFAVPVTSIGGTMTGLGTVNVRGTQAAGRTNTVARNTGTHRHTLNFDLAVTETFLGAFGSSADNVRAFDLIAPSGFSWAPRNNNPQGTGGNYAHHIGAPSFTFSRFNNNNVLRVELTGLNPSQQGTPLGQIILENLELSANNWESTTDQDVYITIRDSQQRTGSQVAGIGSGSHNRVGSNLIWTATGNGNLVPVSAPQFGNYVRVGDIALSSRPNAPAGVTTAVWENSLTPFNNSFVGINGTNLNSLRWNVQSATTGNSGTFAVNAVTNPFVTEQSINVGRIADWAIVMTALSEDLPELVSGRLHNESITGAVSTEHRAVRVRIEENIPNAAHQERTLTFSLPEEVRIREARVFNTRNVREASHLEGTYSGLPGSRRHFNLNNSDNQHVRINNNQIHFTGLTRTGANDNLISFELELYLSIEPGFEGDIDMYLGGSAARNETDTPSVTIAEAISPIVVTADTRNIRVGYQFVPVGNFTIRETRAGALLPHEEVFVSVTDGLFTEMQIAPGFSWEVTQGNIEVANMQVANHLAGIWQGAARPNLSFEVRTASTQPSTIEFSNVQVRLTAVAPDSNVGYDLVVWGPAVARNFNHPLVSQGGYQNVAGSQAATSLNRENYADFINQRDLFNTPGFSAPFVTVGTVAADLVQAPVVFTQDGVVTVGGSVQNFPADLGSFEVNAEGVAVMPARLAFAVLFGNTDPHDAQMFVWNTATSTFHVDPSGRNIQLQVGNQAMIVGGTPRTILSGTGADAFATAPYVNPENSRMMIPVRAFAEALGLTVEWNAAAGSVTLTPEGYVAGN